MIGRWIDSLTDDERDAIIEHPDPTFDGNLWWVDPTGEWSTPLMDPDGCGCLVGTALVQRCRRMGKPLEAEADDADLAGVMTRSLAREWERAGMRFPDLTIRFGPERIWRVVKARAAKANRVPVEPSPEPVKAIR